MGGAILAATNFGYHTLYLAVGIAGVTSFVIAFFLLRESYVKPADQPVKPRFEGRKMLKGWVQVATNKSTLVVTFVQAIQYYVFGVVEFFLVQYMLQVAKLNAFEVGIVMGVQIISLIVSRPLMGRFLTKPAGGYRLFLDVF